MAEVISRDDAIALGLDRYFTGKPCKRGHVAERRTSNGACIPCSLACAKEHYSADPEAHKAYTAKWRAENPLGWWAIQQRQRRAQRAKRQGS